MIPTLEQINSNIRSHLGDTEVQGGQIFKDDANHPAIQESYTALISLMAERDIAKTRRTFHYNLPAYQSYLTPAEAGIADMGNPISVWERSVDKVAAVTAAAPTVGSPSYVDLTSAVHPFATPGMEVLVYGIAGLSSDVNDAWAVTFPNANTVRLLGARPSGTYSTGGIITSSTEEWPTTPMTPGWDLRQPLRPSTTLGLWLWANDVFRFPAASAQRQLRCLYTISGSIPDVTQQSASIPVDDSLDFISLYAAARLASNRVGFQNKAQGLFNLACGNPSGDTLKAQGGALGRLIRPSVRQAQQTLLQTGRFRPRRNVGGLVHY